MRKFTFNSTNFSLIFLKNYVLAVSIILFIILAIAIVLITRSKIGGFQQFILITALVILFITLVSICYALKKSKNTNWPPVVPGCPDYWTSDGSGNNMTCTNVKNLGSCMGPSGSNLVMNFNKPPYIGSSGNCAKYTWANKCGVAWDGINYGVNNPCT